MARYTVLTERQIADVLRQYGWQDAQVEVIAGGAANSSYAVRTSTGRYVVTILDNHDQVTAGRLAALLRHLAGFELPTSRLVRTLDGADLGVFGTSRCWRRNTFPAAVPFRFRPPATSRPDSYWPAHIEFLPPVG